MNLTVQDRIEFFKQGGGSYIESLTPTELAKLFPKYYLQQLPDIGKAVSGGTRGTTGADQPSTGPSTGPSGTAPTATPVPRAGDQQRPQPKQSQVARENSFFDYLEKIQTKKNQANFPQNEKAGAYSGSLKDINPNQLAFLRGLAMTETGLRRKEAYSEALNQARNNANVRKYGQDGADYGYYQTNALDVRDAIKRGVPPEIAKHLHGGGQNGTSTVEQQTLAMHEYLKRKYPSVYEGLASGKPEAYEAARRAMQGQWFGLKDRPEVARAEFAKGPSGNLEKIFPEVIREQIQTQKQKDMEKAPVSSEQATGQKPETEKKKVPDTLPEGLDPKIVDEYNKLKDQPEKQARFRELIANEGVDKTNEYFKQYTPQQIEDKTNKLISEGDRPQLDVIPGNKAGVEAVKQSGLPIPKIQREYTAEQLSRGEERLFHAGGKLSNGNNILHPKLIHVMKDASKDLPPGYRAEMISGADERKTGTKNHPGGLAMDVIIYDEKGKALPHDRNSPGWKVYEQLHRSANIRAQELYPKDKFIWGGAWSGPAAGPADPMHYQIVQPGVGSQTSGAYNFETGLPKNFRFPNMRGQPTEPMAMTAKEREEYDASVRERIKREKEQRQQVTPKQEQAPVSPAQKVLTQEPAPENARYRPGAPLATAQPTASPAASAASPERPVSPAPMDPNNTQTPRGQRPLVESQPQQQSVQPTAEPAQAPKAQPKEEQLRPGDVPQNNEFGGQLSNVTGEPLQIVDTGKGAHGKVVATMNYDEQLVQNSNRMPEVINQRTNPAELEPRNQYAQADAQPNNGMNERQPYYPQQIAPIALPSSENFNYRLESPLKSENPGIGRAYALSTSFSEPMGDNTMAVRTPHNTLS